MTQQQERPKPFLLQGCEDISRWSVSLFYPPLLMKLFIGMCLASKIRVRAFFCHWLCSSQGKAPDCGRRIVVMDGSPLRLCCLIRPTRRNPDASTFRAHRPTEAPS